LGQETGEAESGFDLEGEEDFAVESRDAEMGVREIDQGIEVAVERLGKSTNGGRLASADIASNEGGEMVLEGEGQATLDLAVAVRGIKILGGDGLGERGL
jgi:hypothetical protein